MKHTEWLMDKYPKLRDEPSAKTFALIEQAKDRTKGRMLIILSICTLAAVLLAYFLAALSSQFISLDFPIVFGVTYGLVFVLLGGLQKRLERLVIQNKIIELMGDSEE
ncbi:hypothetical protein ISG33_01605 [Glaciecola sp. MH2013]|uniref:hypothetical protein n=1 Tax=Glaciecola sp. MH2013 TaxID=2785524 RepID=UPI00189E5DF3|nr:hypothetical protein [Glaciecola sp. MH2013]MBF7072096.1 hypothetical protein [Glaciecola sp. MH2013]